MIWWKPCKVPLEFNSNTFELNPEEDMQKKNERSKGRERAWERERERERSSFIYISGWNDYNIQFYWIIFRPFLKYYLMSSLWNYAMGNSYLFISDNTVPNLLRYVLICFTQLKETLDIFYSMSFNRKVVILHYDNTLLHTAQLLKISNKNLVGKNSFILLNLFLLIITSLGGGTEYFGWS